MFHSPSARRILVAAALLAIPLGLLGFLLLMQSEFRQNRDLRESMESSVVTRGELSEVLVEHLNIETGQRGYLVTGDRAFLVPYEAGRQRIDGALERLGDTVSQEPQLAPGIDRLKNLSKAKLAFAEVSIDRADSGDFGSARTMIAGGEGKRLMDAIRAEVRELDRVESDRLAAMTSERDSSRQRIETTTYLLLAVFSLLLAVIALFTARTIRERQREYARANELGQRQQAILDGTVDGILLLDDKGYIIEANPSIERQFGFSETELEGKHNTFLMAEPPSLADSIWWLHRVGSAGRSGAGQRHEFTGRHQDGALIETDVAISRIPGDGERRYVAIIRDVTERKRIESMKTEFVSTVSHELRTPLTSIGGSLGLLAAGAVGPLNEKAARLVQIAHSNCERLIRLINDILDIEKIESGKMHFDLKRMRIGPMLDRVAAANAQFAASHGVELKVNHSAWPLMVEGDADRLDQVLTNLVSNAIKHSPQGGTVEVAAFENGGKVRIEVADRGAGIPPDFRDRIFGKFAMADSSDSRARGGTGLGLSIAREITMRHGGTIGFADRPGGGTVFAVDLPLICEASPVERPTPSPSLPAVLHIDDDSDCLDVVASAFEGKAAVISVSSLDEARGAIAERIFAAAIVDVAVDPDSGLDLIPHLRESRPAMPIVLFTAFDASYRDAGVDAVLVKSRNPVGELVRTTLRLAAERTDEAA